MRQQDSMIIHHGSFKSDPFYQHKCQFRLSPDLHFLILRLFIQRIIAFIVHFFKVLSTVDYLFNAPLEINAQSNLTPSLKYFVRINAH